MATLGFACKFLLTIVLLIFMVREGAASKAGLNYIKVKFAHQFYQNPFWLGDGDIMCPSNLMVSASDICEFSQHFRVFNGLNTHDEIENAMTVVYRHPVKKGDNSFEDPRPGKFFSKHPEYVLKLGRKFGGYDSVSFQFWVKHNYQRAGQWSGQQLAENISETVELNPRTFQLSKFYSGAVKAAEPQEPHLIRGISLGYSMECLEYVYGAKCDIYCKPENNNIDGHYDCDSEGNKICLPGWKNSKNSCNQQSLCFGNPCQNGGTCQEMEDEESIWCECSPEYDGFMCEECTYCQNGGTCDLKNGNIICQCPPGYTGIQCENLGSICKAPNQPCKNGGTCYEIISGYLCDCATGYGEIDCAQTLSHDYCKDWGGNPCDNLGTCVNIKGSFNCSCPAGVRGRFCETDIDECSDKSSQCEHNEKCINTVGSYFCLLEDKNECDGVKCDNGGTCVDLEYTFYCKCPNGFSGYNCNYSVNRTYNKAYEEIFGWDNETSVGFVVNQPIPELMVICIATAALIHMILIK